MVRQVMGMTESAQNCTIILYEFSFADNLNSLSGERRWSDNPAAGRQTRHSVWVGSQSCFFYWEDNHLFFIGKPIMFFFIGKPTMFFFIGKAIMFFFIGKPTRFFYWKPIVFFYWEANHVFFIGKPIMSEGSVGV